MPLVASAPDQPRSNTRWLLVGWIFVLSAVSYLDRVNISIAGSSLASEFNLTTIQLGTIFSAFLFGYAIFQTTGGYLADRFGPRRVLTAGALWWGIFTSLTAAVSPKAAAAFALLIATRFLLGAGEAVMFPGSNQFVSRWIPPQEQGIANGVIFGGVGVGAAITPTLIAYIMSRYGWRWSFWTSAILGVGAGLVWYVIARDTPEQHEKVSPEELAHIRGKSIARSQSNVVVPADEAEVAVLTSAQRSESNPAHPKPAQSKVPWSIILRSREVWAITVAYFCYGYIAWIFFAWFFIYLAKVRGLNLKTSATYTTLPFIAMALCSPLGGVVSDRLVAKYGQRLGRCTMPIIGLVLTAIFLVLGARTAEPRLAGIVLAGGAGALYLSASSFWAVTASISRGSSGSVSGVMNTGNQLGGMLTAQLTPIIAAHYNWSAPFFVAACFAALAAACWLLIDPTRTLESSS